MGSSGRELDHRLNSSTHSYTMASTSLSSGQISELQVSGDYAIKSEAVAPKLGASEARNFVYLEADPSDTSQWPLLLKNYDKLLVRSSHFTPIPSVSLLL